MDEVDEDKVDDDEEWDFDEDIESSRIEGENERDRISREVNETLNQQIRGKLESLKTKLVKEIKEASREGTRSLTFTISKSESEAWETEVQNGKITARFSVEDFIDLLSKRLSKYNFRPDLIKNGHWDPRKRKWCRGYKMRADGNCDNCGFTESVHSVNTLISFSVSW